MYGEHPAHRLHHFSCAFAISTISVAHPGQIVAQETARPYPEQKIVSSCSVDAQIVTGGVTSHTLADCTVRAHFFVRVRISFYSFVERIKFAGIICVFTRSIVTCAGTVIPCERCELKTTITKIFCTSSIAKRIVTLAGAQTRLLGVAL